MSDFKWRYYPGDIILNCVRWYCKYGISYRDLEEMMTERGVAAEHTTLLAGFSIMLPRCKNVSSTSGNQVWV